MVVNLVSPRLSVLAEGVLQWLASHQQPDGNLWDPVSCRPLPADHYGTMLFAAACTLSENATDLAKPAERAVRYYLQIPRLARGAHEVNNLGLLCVYRRWQETGLVPDLHPALGEYLLSMPFESVASPTTNNWDAVRAVCLAQRSSLLGSAHDVRAARQCLHQRILPLQGSDGLFADYPAANQKGDRATPLTYHAKICAMLAMFLREIDDDAASEALARGVTGLAHFCAPNGESLYFGRGCNSLYGYASAVYGIFQALKRRVIATTDRSLVAQAGARIAAFLLRMRQPDGRIRLYPTEFDAEELGWDDFVHRLDYNPFAAFLLLQTPEVSALPQVAWEPAGFDARQAGLIVRERDGVFAAFSTRGQLNTGSYLFMDGRYAGMQPLTLQHDGRTIIPPPPHDFRSPTDPRWMGFMPVVSLAEDIWAVRVYDEVRTVEDDFTALIGRGTPVTLRMGLRRRLTKATRENAGWIGRAFARWAAPLALRFVRIPPAYEVAEAPGVQVRRAVILLPRLRALCLVERVDGRFDSAWSTVRLAGACTPVHDGYCSQIEGLEVKIWTSSPLAQAEVHQVFTSNGPAHILRIPIAPGATHVSAICFAPDVTVSVSGNRGRRVITTVQAGDLTRRLVVDLDALQVAGE